MDNAWMSLGVALAIGLLVGAERERAKSDSNAGIRTFALAAVLGNIAAAVPLAFGVAVVIGALTVIIVGYHRAQRPYFHRYLPYDRPVLYNLNPRLIGARELVEQGAVRLDEDGGATVRSGETDYLVRVEDAVARCTCA